MNTNDAFEQMLEQEMQRSAAVVDPNVEAALAQVRGSASRADHRHSNRPRSHWFLAVAAAIAIIGGGVFTADRLGEVDPDEVVVGDGGDVSTTVTQEPPVDETTATTGPVTTAATAPETTTNESQPTTTVDPPQTTVPGSQGFELVDDGFNAIDAETGELTLVPFGTPREEVLELIAASIGEPLFDNPLDQCGRGPTDSISWGGLSVYVDSDSGTAVGWLLGEAGEGPTTITGTEIGLGSTVAELRAARPGVQSDEGTLGWEFWDGTAGWFTSGPNDSDIIEALWGGEICVYR